MKLFRFSLVVAVALLAIAPMLQAQGVGTAACREVQRVTQLTVGDETNPPYRNHGAYVSAAAAVVSPAVAAGTIDAECASCIMNQFARSIPLAEQAACGPPTRVKPLRGPETTPCDGPIVGTLSILNVGPFGLEVIVDITAGAANTTFQTFWTCTTVANGCHNNACGFTDIGQVSTNAAGQGSATIPVPGGNPYPGQYVHFDLCPGSPGGCSGGPIYTSVCGTIWPSAPSSPSTSAAPSSAGDPTKQ